MSITGDHRLLKRLNRMAVVRRVRQAPGSSRADLANATGLTKSTISLLTQELIDEGWLVELEIESPGLQARSTGRPPTPLTLDEHRLAFIGVDIGLGSATVVATNLVGKVLTEHTARLDTTAPEQVCREVATLIEARLASEALRQRTTVGIGIGVPGAVDERTGVLRFAPNIGWKDVALRDLLRAALAAGPAAGLPLYLQNDADVAALGEFEFGDPQVLEPLVFLGLGTGVGAGIVVNDRLLTGWGGFAGEVGHTVLDAAGPLCSCGRRGCAEAFIGLAAVTQAVLGTDQLPRTRDPSALLQSLPPAAFDADRAHRDPALRAALDRAGQHLGLLMQNLWAAFDPAVIVLGGPTCELGDSLLGPARERLERYAQEAGLQPPTVRQARFGRLAHAVGAAAAVIHYQVRPLSDAAMRGSAVAEPA
ncbi:ROK family protein [Caldimonas brevitalea]|uniref:Xylose-responsive transcription regulator, ROK family n=1 Tax=Caldimonas brevitalea TaxID=413882 RepID=A0A0G3BRE2_9BURK|nr:ROK family protein [Caldimonas brevitalea]AKJ29926.1 xylose-responsive transcription regulator, ROK family [Caldimonas brevitalea]